MNVLFLCCIGERTANDYGPECILLCDKVSCTRCYAESSDNGLTFRCKECFLMTAYFGAFYVTKWLFKYIFRDHSPKPMMDDGITNIIAQMAVFYKCTAKGTPDCGELIVSPKKAGAKAEDDDTLSSSDDSNVNNKALQNLSEDDDSSSRSFRREIGGKILTKSIVQEPDLSHIECIRSWNMQRFIKCSKCWTHEMEERCRALCTEESEEESSSFQCNYCRHPDGCICFSRGDTTSSDSSSS